MTSKHGTSHHEVSTEKPAPAVAVNPKAAPAAKPGAAPAAKTGGHGDGHSTADHQKQGKHA